MIRRKSILAVVAAALFTLSLSSVASAQSNDPWWGRNSGNNRNSGSYGRYDGRTLRDVAQRIKDRSHNLESDVNRALDHSRVNGSRREDNINADVQEFRRAADRFKDRVGNGNDPNRASNEAQALLSLSSRVDNELSRLRLDSRSYSDWSEINQDLRVVSDIYGYGYGNNGYPNSRYPNDRRTNDGWWRRLPDVINGRRP
ncbi:MAG: hypothetical protein QOE33_633 [Acidobacteriota bacterium]|nr:hypothetical protein [Acidobacteriota bacterium]